MGDKVSADEWEVIVYETVDRCGMDVPRERAM
jgi:hypothetical protein